MDGSENAALFHRSRMLKQKEVKGYREYRGPDGRRKGGRGDRRIKERIGRRAGDKTYWPGAGPAVEAGCRASLCGPKGADGQREGDEKIEINSVRTGFIPPGPQNWAGPGRKSEEERVEGKEQQCYLYHFIVGLNVTQKGKKGRYK